MPFPLPGSPLNLTASDDDGKHSDIDVEVEVNVSRFDSTAAEFVVHQLVDSLDPAAVAASAAASVGDNSSAFANVTTGVNVSLAVDLGGGGGISFWALLLMVSHQTLSF